MSECCKEINFYVPPDAVRSSLITSFACQHDMDLYDCADLPKKFDGLILNLQNHKNIITYRSDMDPRIEITIEEVQSTKVPHSLLLNEAYIYHAKGIDAPCYYVDIKIHNGQNEQFRCIDTTTPFGSKRLRQYLQNVDDSQFTLYRVKVKSLFPEEPSERVDAEILKDIERILNKDIDLNNNNDF